MKQDYASETNLFLTDLSSPAGVAIAMEAERLTKKYKKDFFNADDLAKIMGIGKNNARALMNSNDFPTIQIGNRKVVSVIAFVYWSIKNNA